MVSVPEIKNPSIHALAPPGVATLQASQCKVRLPAYSAHIANPIIRLSTSLHCTWEANLRRKAGVNWWLGIFLDPPFIPGTLRILH